MATGLKQNNVKHGDGTSWEDLYEINAGSLTNATRNNFFVEIKKLPNGGTKADCFYIGTGALTLSQFANLPLGSTILCPCISNPSLYLKTAAAGTATFKYQAINT